MLEQSRRDLPKLAKESQFSEATRAAVEKLSQGALQDLAYSVVDAAIMPFIGSGLVDHIETSIDPMMIDLSLFSSGSRFDQAVSDRFESQLKSLGCQSSVTTAGHRVHPTWRAYGGTAPQQSLNEQRQTMTVPAEGNQDLFEERLDRLCINALSAATLSDQVFTRPPTLIDNERRIAKLEQLLGDNSSYGDQNFGLSVIRYANDGEQTTYLIKEAQGGDTLRSMQVYDPISTNDSGTVLYDQSGRGAEQLFAYFETKIDREL